MYVIVYVPTVNGFSKGYVEQPDHPEYVQLTKKRAKCPFLLLIQSYQLCVYDGFRQILFVTKHQQYLGLSVRL